jgi:hypothetical protein
MDVHIYIYIHIMILYLRVYIYIHTISDDLMNAIRYSLYHEYYII